MSASAAVTLEQAVATATSRLAEAGIEAPRRDARLLVCSLLGGGPELLLARPERPLDAAETAGIAAAVERRARREPISRILGRREFWSLEFQLGPETLDPRPDSETLVEAVLDFIPRRDAELRILDLGCGSGCLLLALLSELPVAQGLGIDLAPGAVAASAENARRLGLGSRAEFVQGSWQDGLQGVWNIVVSNPPYIPTAEIAGLAPEVAAYDPPLALDGGTDGLAAYRSLIPAAAAVLHGEGLLALEVGAGQSAAVRGLLEEAGFPTIRVARDLSGIERCVLATQARKSRASAQELADVR
ncbi:peptide chain release factor N(5)-glutamine methyltransferase [Pelagibius litoralis]|uniref:Release factor glutamine methyltransferase n=1 Tax=Pelagibius litoralis TaxID=374515 RepID=A0A967F2L7_9PROT|nr:peptide chain release factor N(5)-glutamine methyltransferase [Pelagibius litoralis]NIA71873.1 peptide chain release factor N(5)-glutamine methyltransferase [Pelagibius litoralis]